VVFFVFLLEFGAVPTVRYLLFSYWSLELCLQCGICCFSIGVWSCSYSVVFVVFLVEFELFLQCGIFCFSIRFCSCSYSVVFVVFLLEFGGVPTVWYLLFFY
jgi:hypothetical protein